MCMSYRGHLEEDDREKGEDEALDKPDEDFETEEGERGEVGEEERDDNEEDFSREDVPKETEGEGNHFRALCNEFEDADKAHDGVFPWGDEIFSSVRENSECSDAEGLGHDDGNEGDREGHIHIRIHRTEKRDGEDMSFMHSFDRDTSDPWEDTHPVGENEEEEDRRDEGEECPCAFAVLDDRIKEVEEAFNDKFYECLEAPGNCCILGKPNAERNGEKDEHSQPRHEHGVS